MQALLKVQNTNRCGCHHGQSGPQRIGKRHTCQLKGLDQQETHGNLEKDTPNEPTPVVNGVLEAGHGTGLQTHNHKNLDDCPVHLYSNYRHSLDRK